ncbi:reverse transcriptase domain-containing protein [Aurantibacillus circumpalustris]|uniref:reverse transcriptase domain-containing protein n=1 Tax=Aurantibacillus circumpalustris TaxID=3036359 RepID=UPI00295BFF55|nr:reverse transcriptase domain-containing protein [Aurantibacillus circumpalustris]
MKRIGNIYQNICSVDNLRLAEKKARKGKLTQPGVKQFDLNSESYILLLHEALLNKTYKTSEYKVFKIFEPKERDVYRLPYYPDRITHHAVMNILEPMFNSVFTSDTYSCIKKKGIHGASYALRSALKDKNETKYCLKLDVKKFYPSVDHNVLKKLLRRKIKDLDLLWLLDEIIDSAPGLPIGNYLSQYFANFYLTYFDHWIKESVGVKFYFRYSDDLVILAPNKEYLHKLLADIKNYLNSSLNLTVKSNYRIFPVSCGIDFVGYVHYHDYVKMRKTIKQDFARAVNRNPQSLSVPSYYGWAKHCNSKNLLKKLFMKSFSDLGIKPSAPAMEGDKIEIYQIINQQITVHGYSLKPSKFEGKGDCLYLQITYEGRKRVVFTGSGALMETIKKVPSESFPFTTIITKENKRCQFT